MIYIQFFLTLAKCITNSAVLKLFTKYSPKEALRLKIRILRFEPLKLCRICVYNPNPQYLYVLDKPLCGR